MKIGDSDVQLQNTVYQTTPLVIHGNGPAKVLLNSLGNYLAKSWTQDDGCLACAENQKDITALNVSSILLYILYVLSFQKVLPYVQVRNILDHLDQYVLDSCWDMSVVLAKG